MRRRFAVDAAWAALVALGAACGGATEPVGPRTTTYALVSIDGQPLPFTPPDRPAVRVFADTLRLTRQRPADQQGTYERTYVNSINSPVRSDLYAGTWAEVGMGIALDGQPPLTMRSDGALIFTGPAHHVASMCDGSVSCVYTRVGR
jgi:hypothetical protein